MNDEPVTIDLAGEAKKWGTIVYALQAASFLIGITIVVGVILNYLKAEVVRDTFVESHFRWQRRTFWFGLLWAVIGAVTFAFVIGYFILVANGIWIIYRVVKGWLKLSENQPMYLR